MSVYVYPAVEGAAWAYGTYTAARSGYNQLQNDYKDIKYSYNKARRFTKRLKRYVYTKKAWQPKRQAKTRLRNNRFHRARS